MIQISRLVERLVNLQRGDTARSLLLFTHLFLIMSGYMAARIARDGMLPSRY